jgi:hypothetical protein
MGLLKEKRYLEHFRNNENIRIISIITTSKNFEKKFDSSISSFWKALKNGLYSFGGRTNRQVMRGLSGVYFSLEMGEEMQIIIVYDASKKALNQLDTSIRLKKLLGLNIQIEYGTFEAFEPAIQNMFGIRRKIQPFGDYYFANKSSLKGKIAK